MAPLARLRPRSRHFQRTRRLPSWAAFKLVLMLGAIFGFLLPDLLAGFNVSAGATEIACNLPRVIDGDTMDCAGVRIRLASIDAPEMPGHCAAWRDCTPGDPYAARNYLSLLTRGAVACRPVEIDHYGRTVASCRSDGRDLSCAMVAAGRAVRRYGWLWC